MDTPKPCPTCGLPLSWGAETLVGPSAVCANRHVFIANKPRYQQAELPS